MPDYFETKEANEASDKASKNLKRSIKAMKAFKMGELRLKTALIDDIANYRIASRKARKTSKAYIEQCLTQ